jgi:transcriptional regulator with XRE-family HTH domain
MRRHVPGVCAMTPAQAFGSTLAELRQRKKMTVGKFAHRAKISETRVTSLEAGTGKVTLDVIFKLARALSIPPARLVAGAEMLMDA